MSTKIDSIKLRAIQLNRNKLVDKRIAIIKFAFIMLIVRLMFVLLAKTNTNMSLWELYCSRFYYGDGGINIERLIDPITFDSKAFMYFCDVVNKNLITMMILGPFYFGVGLVLFAIKIMLMLLFQILIYLISVSDSLSPRGGNIIIWWIMYSIILGTIINIPERKKKLTKLRFVKIIIVSLIALSILNKAADVNSLKLNNKYYNAKTFFR